MIRGARVRWRKVEGEREKERASEVEGNSRRDAEREPMRLSREDEAWRRRKGGRGEKGGEDPLSECQEWSEGQRRSGCGIERTEKEAGESR